MSERAGGSASDCVSKPGGTAFGNHDSVRAGGECRSNHCAEVVRIFDAIEKDDEAFASVAGTLVRGGKNAFERCRRTSGGEGYNALMIFRIGKAVELPAVFKPDRNVASTGELHDFFNASVLPPARDQDAVERAVRVQSLANGVDPSEL